MLVLRAQGGFCNRLRAIVSAALWAEDLGTGLVIYWPEEPGHMACRIDEILVPRTIPGIVKFHTGYIRNARQVLSHADMESVLEVQRLMGVASPGQSPMEQGPDEIRIESYSIFHNEFHSRGIKILRAIQVHPSIQKMTEGVKDGLVGIHIRRTDHVKCISASPLAAFEKYLDEADRGNFYLATDDAEVKAAFKEKFTKHFIASPVTKLGRLSKEQQIHGIIDWLLLQKCTRIVASQGSSFSELAAWRAGIPLEVL
jgi:hypothetical protein